MVGIPKVVEKALGAALQDSMAAYEKKATEMINKLNDNISLLNEVIEAQNETMQGIASTYALLKWHALQVQEPVKDAGNMPEPLINMEVESDKK